MISSAALGPLEDRRPRIRLICPLKSSDGEGAHLSCSTDLNGSKSTGVYRPTDLSLGIIQRIFVTDISSLAPQRTAAA